METLPINAADVIVIVVLFLSAILAFSRGLVQELLGVGAWVGAAFATLYAFVPAQRIARDLISIELAADLCAGVTIFLASLVLLSALSRLLSRRVRHSSLGALDRSLGVLFGLLRGAVLICLAWIALAWLLPSNSHPGWIAQARSRPLVETGAQMLRDLLPPEYQPSTQSVVTRDASARAGPLDLSAGIEQFLQPAPAFPIGQGPAAAGGKGYEDRQRKAMQQVIEAIK